MASTQAYVTQDDVLMATLTVKETIYYSAQLQLPNSLSQYEKRARAEETMRAMGLDGVKDMRIGSGSTKGISGGQRRRVSICLEILTHPQLLFLDEPTSGLDSAASYHVMSRISSLACEKGMTVVGAIHQPSSEDGGGDEGGDVEAITSAEKAISILVSAYKSSDYSHKVTQSIADICIMYEKEHEVGNKCRRPSFISQLLVLTKRSFANMHRDLAYYWFRIGIYTIVGERLNGHYNVSVFVISNTLSSIPFLAVISLIPGALAYYLAGLQSGVSHFIFFILCLFESLIIVESLMMIVASIVPDYLMGIIAGAGIQGIMLLNCGFFQPANLLPKPFFKYLLHYIAFHTYAYQAFLKNEFLGLSLPSGIDERSPGISGYRLLRDVWSIDMSQSKWVDLGFLFAIFVIYRMLFLVIVKIRDKVKPVNKIRFYYKAHST
ncbi:ABC transporter G family member 2 [Rhynchospora pubera]|uniref:ABC transporter G family member 2 n=1 Tax=Rhynchospora pubera TaxID=906938 RepID=A0AAV8GTI4_9POAL|nr:ABC transporter G family member 2 [Rhynchospora pubera]